jgi:hypothetical protein
MVGNIGRGRARPAGDRLHGSPQGLHGAFHSRLHGRRDAQRLAVADPAARRAALRRRRLLATLLAAVLVLAGALIGIQLMPVRYAATSVVSFVPRPSTLTSADTVQLVGQKYVVLATSPVTLTAAERAVGAPLGLLSGSTGAVLGTGTGNVSVTVTLPDGNDAAEAANAIALALVVASRADHLVEGQQTAPAESETAVRKPPRPLLRVAALLAASLTGLLVWTALAGLGRPREPAPEPVAVGVR